VVGRDTKDVKWRLAKLAELRKLTGKWIADHPTDERREQVEVVLDEVDREAATLAAPPAPAATPEATPKATAWSGAATPTTTKPSAEKAAAPAAPVVLPARPKEIGTVLDHIISTGESGKPASADGSKHAVAAKLPKYTRTKVVNSHYAAEYTKGSTMLADMVRYNDLLCNDEPNWITFATKPENLGLTPEQAASYDTPQKRFVAYWEGFGWTVPEVAANQAKLAALKDDPPPTGDDGLLAAEGPKDESKVLVDKVDPKDVGRYQLHLGGTITRGDDPAPFDTADHFSKFSGKGFAIFVMNGHGDFYSESHKVGKFHHSSFLPGVPVASAGEISIRAGKVVKVTSKSGHYRPTSLEMVQVLQELESNGVDLATVDYFQGWSDGTVDQGTYNAKAFKEENEGRLTEPA
jgi:hypothetical protein